MSPDQVLSHLRNHRGMWLVRDDYNSLVAFLVGFDAASHCGFLTGFQELIELKNGATSNVHWSSLALRLRWPDADATGATEQEKIAWLLDLLEEFLTIDAGSNLRVRRLFYEWVTMAQAEKWHLPDLLRFSRSPAPESVRLEVAATDLGLSLPEVLSLVRDGTLVAGRLGGEVLITRQSLGAAMAASRERGR